MVVEARLAQANGTSAVSAKRYAVIVGINDYSGAGIGDVDVALGMAGALQDSPRRSRSPTR